MGFNSSGLWALGAWFQALGAELLVLAICIGRIYQLRNSGMRHMEWVYNLELVIH